MPRGSHVCHVAAMFFFLMDQVRLSYFVECQLGKIPMNLVKNGPVVGVKANC